MTTLPFFYRGEMFTNDKNIIYNCLWCGAVVPYRKSRKTQTCGRICKSAHYQREQAEMDEIWRKTRKPVKKHKRKCLYCKKPCWPNMYYCNTCHTRVKEYVDEA